MAWEVLEVERMGREVGGGVGVRKGDDGSEGGGPLSGCQ